MKFKEKIEDLITKVSTEEELVPKFSPKVTKIDDEELKSYISFEAEPWMLNRRQEVHGGIITTMFDIAMGLTANACLEKGKQVTTAGLNVSYIRPFTNHDYIIVSEISNAGKTLIRVYAKAIDSETKTVMALCTGDFVPYKEKIKEEE